MPAISQVHTGIRANRYRICYSESKISDSTKVPWVLCMPQKQDSNIGVSEPKASAFQPLNTAS